MNRAQRRAAARQQRRAPAPRRLGAVAGVATGLEPLYLLENARPNTPEEKAGAHLRTLAAFDRLRGGTGSDADFDHVAMVLNITKVRAMDIDETLADMIEQAQDAMQRCQQRRAQCAGRYVLDGPAISQIDDALAAAREIVNHSTPLQLRAARRTVTDQIAGKGAWRRIERGVIG